MKAILWISVAIATGFYISGPIVDPDLWWHISIGRWINHHAALPHVDYWNMFGVGKAWRAYSWTFESFVAMIDTHWGVHGLLVSQWMLATVIALSFSWGFSVLSKDYLFGSVVGAFATVACFNHYTLRPQSITWILFMLAVVAADRYKRDGAKGALVALFFLGMAWANVHLAAMLGLAAIGAWLWSAGSRRVFMSACGVFFLGTLFTPYFGGEWLTLMSKAGHPFQYSTIAEFQPATVMQYTTAFVLLLAFTLTLVARDTGVRIAHGIIAGALVFLLAGLAVVKFLPYAILFLASVLCVVWRDSANLPHGGNLLTGLRALCATLSRIPREGLAFLFLCTAVVNGMNVWQSPIALSYVPKNALDFLEEAQLAEPYLTTFGDGGYLMYRLTNLNGMPRALVPIDGRTNVSPREVIHAQQETLRGGEGWRSFIDLVQPRTIVWRRESPLTSILREGREWCEVYRDGSPKKGYTVFVRRDDIVRYPSLTDSCNAAGNHT